MRKSFYRIDPVPQANDLIDICLNKTNRKTPTVIHKHFEITRIRKFYIKKIQFASDEFIEKLSEIVDSFPMLEDIHPFYSEMISILYDKDNFKIALGKVSATKSKIQTIYNSTFKMLKFADTMYRCKCLKRAGLGQMATTVSKLKDELLYLENVRQHFARLPVIDPHSRTIIVAGFPNVGKSSFVSSVTNCKTEVQSYAFTTKSLYVGHFDFNNLRYQIIDTPGILDRPLEARSKAEMLSITALAHLTSSLLYFIDISCSCGYSIEQQIALFNGIAPLINSRALIVLSKTDIVMFNTPVNEQCVAEATEAFINNTPELAEFLKDKAYTSISNDGNVNFTKTAEISADMILADRLASKENTASFEHRIKITKAAETNVPLSEDFIGENIYLHSVDPRDAYQIEHKYDTIPEIMNGKNITDYMAEDSLKEKLELITLPEIIHYDTLTQEQRKLYEDINNTRISANMASIFNKRKSIVIKGFELDKTKINLENTIIPNRNTVQFNKKSTTAKRGIENIASVKHIYRGKK